MCLGKTGPDRSLAELLATHVSLDKNTLYTADPTIRKRHLASWVLLHPRLCGYIWCSNVHVKYSKNNGVSWQWAGLQRAIRPFAYDTHSYTYDTRRWEWVDLSDRRAGRQSLMALWHFVMDFCVIFVLAIFLLEAGRCFISTRTGGSVTLLPLWRGLATLGLDSWFLGTALFALRTQRRALFAWRGISGQSPRSCEDAR